MISDTSIRGSVSHVALVVLFAVVVTVAGIAPAVAGSPSAGSVYQISGMDVPASVTNGESYTVSAQLSNAGDTDMQVVAFRIDMNGDGEFTPNESLGAEAFVLLEGDTRNVTFDVTVPEDLASGEYEYMLWTESSSTTGTVDVESPVAPATFLLAGASAPESVAAGDSFVVSADVANVGDLNGSETLSLYVDSNGDGTLSDEEAIANTTFELASASNGTVNLSATAPDLKPGKYAIGVGTSTEMVSGMVAIERAPASFGVVSLRADRAMVGGTVSVSTIVENTGDERRTGDIEVRLDTNGDGVFSPDETVRTRDVTLGAGSSQQHGFAIELPSDYTPGEYELALVTPTTERVTSFEVFRPTSSSSSSDSGGESESESESDATTREDVAQALYGESYDSLSKTKKYDVEDVYSRLPAEIPLSEIETRQQISQRLYDGEDFLVDDEFDNDGSGYTLTVEQAETVQDTYDDQFGALPSSPEYSENEIAIALFGTSYDSLGATGVYQVRAVYNRQPIVDGLELNSSKLDDTSAEVLRTQRRIANIYYDDADYVRGHQTMGSESGLSMDDLLEIYQTWIDQFENN